MFLFFHQFEDENVLILFLSAIYFLVAENQLQFWFNYSSGSRTKFVELHWNFSEKKQTSRKFDILNTSVELSPGYCSIMEKIITSACYQNFGVSEASLTTNISIYSNLKTSPWKNIH